MRTHEFVQSNECEGARDRRLMPVQSPSGRLLEKWLAVDITALHALAKNHPDEAQELAGRVNAAMRRIAPDLFEERRTEEK